MLRDLKAAGVDISEREQRTNVLRALPAGDDRWKPFITMMTHNENIKTFAKITKHLDVKPKEGIEKREEKGRTRNNRGRTGDTHGQARSCVAGRRVLVRPV